jgi:hypothetical protein
VLNKPGYLQMPGASWVSSDDDKQMVLFLYIDEPEPLDASATR